MQIRDTEWFTNVPEHCAHEIGGIIENFSSVRHHVYGAGQDTVGPNVILECVYSWRASSWHRGLRTRPSIAPEIRSMFQRLLRCRVPHRSKSLTLAWQECLSTSALSTLQRNG